MLTQQIITLLTIDNLQTIPANSHEPCLENEEPVINCPDCFDTMIKMYYSDKPRYRCDLVIGEIGVEVFDE